jgi:membrane fusion protein, multidrug efflux system
MIATEQRISPDKVTMPEPADAKGRGVPSLDPSLGWRRAWRLAALVVPLLLLQGCGKGAGKADGGSEPLVVVATVQPHDFADRIEAVGTAYAREATTLTSTVTERIVRLNFTDGAFVQKGAVIAELRQAQQSASYADARARLVGAEQRLERMRALQERGFATNASLDEQVALRDSAHAQAGLAQAQIGDRVIRAPFSGVVGLRRLSVGATAQAGTEIATISDISMIKLDFPLPEAFLSALRVGQTIEAHAAAYPGDVFRGTIDSIDPVVDPATRSLMVRALLPNGDRRLHPGMLLTVSVVSNPRRSLAVPELALVGERDRNFVFKVDRERTALKTPVEIGVRQDQLVEIKRGLKAGDRFIAEGVVKARDGGKVKSAPPASPGR